MTDTPAPTERSVHLSTSGVQARILPDEHDSGWVLEVGGAVQSHVDPEDPTRIRYEYLRRMANVLDALWPESQPLRILHLGAGALTLPRYAQATRPGSVQTVVDRDRELVSFVTAAVPLQWGTDLAVVVGDARHALAEVDADGWDAVVLDIGTGEEGAEHLTGAEYYGELLGMLAPEGVLLVNIGDDAGLRFFARQAAELEVATRWAGLSGAWTLADATLIARRDTGNLVLAAGGGLDALDAGPLQDALLSAGPHPAAVLDPAETARLATALG